MDRLYGKEGIYLLKPIVLYKMLKGRLWCNGQNGVIPTIRVLRGLAGRHRTLKSLPRRTFFPSGLPGSAVLLISSCRPSLLSTPIVLRCCSLSQLSSPILPSTLHFIMTPSPSEAVAKVAQAAAGTQSSAKVYKRESNTARVLGAGT